MDYEEILNNMITKGKITKEEAEKRILEKQRELSNLISKEGAAYIISKEMGLDIFPKIDRRLEIRNVVPLIRDLKLSGRIVSISDIKEFESKGRMGKVASIVLGDATGTIRLTLWDEQTELIDRLEPGMAIETFSAYTRKNPISGTEIRLGKRGGIKILEDSNLPDLEEIKKIPAAKTKNKIVELKEGDTAEIRAAVVQLFENKLFFTVCPKCGKSVRKENDYTCDVHGKVEPQKHVILLGVVDDGTGNMRAVFFREKAQDLSGIESSVLSSMAASEASDMIREKVLGSEIVLKGRVQKNKIFETLEIIADEVKEVDIEKESKKLIEEIIKFKSEEN